MEVRSDTRTGATPSPGRRWGGRMSEEASFRRAKDGFSLRLPGGPAAASTARRALAHLRDDLEEPLMETVRLLVTELVSNSVRHASSRFVSVKAVVPSSSVCLEVTDHGRRYEVGGALPECTQSDES